MDADLGLANVHLLFNKELPVNNLSHFLSDQCSLTDIIYPSEIPNLYLLPASSGNIRMSTLGIHEMTGLIHAISENTQTFDFFLMDTAAGLSESVLGCVGAAHEIILVVCNEPGSLTDAYALIKVLSTSYKIQKFHILANRVKNLTEGRQIYDHLVQVSDRFLNIALHYLGSIPEDVRVIHSIRQGRPLVDSVPHAPASLAFQSCAGRLSRLSFYKNRKGCPKCKIVL